VILLVGYCALMVNLIRSISMRTMVSLFVTLPEKRSWPRTEVVRS
jgi:hypothetical protein